jgi:hypothetical protein
VLQSTRRCARDVVVLVVAKFELHESRVASRFFVVLRPGSNVGLGDLQRSGQLPNLGSNTPAIAYTPPPSPPANQLFTNPSPSFPSDPRSSRLEPYAQTRKRMDKATPKEGKLKGLKRGRKQDDSLPPSVSRSISLSISKPSS